MHISILLTSSDISCFNFSEKQLQRLQDALSETSITRHTDRNLFLKSLPNADIVIAWDFKQEWFELAPKLKWLVTPTAGKDFFKVDLPDGVTIIYSAFHGQIISETVIGMMLASSRGIIESYRMQMEGKEWSRSEVSKNMNTLRGCNLVILGFGNIGQWIAKLAKPFGMRITGVKRSLIPLPDYMDKDDIIITIDQLDSVLPQADYLVLALPAEEKTNNIINKHNLDLLPAHARIYNIGRGNAIDENALAQSLSAGKLAFAGLDVFKKEPLPGDSPLRKCPNILIMPHASAFAPEFLDLFIDEFIVKFKKKF